MASARAMIERRRSSRVMARIPVSVRLKDAPGQRLDAATEATSVSRSGALLSHSVFSRSGIAYRSGTWRVAGIAGISRGSRERAESGRLV